MRQFSIELCGGTHVKNTGEIKRLKIVSEGALSSGVRRIEALTGERVEAWEKSQNEKSAQAQDKLKSQNEKLRQELKELNGVMPAGDSDLEKQNKTLQKQIADLRRQKGASQGADEIKNIAGIKFAGKVLDGFPPGDLKPMVDDLKSQLGSGIIALVATNDGKASIVVGVTSDLTGKFSAVELVKIGSAALGGQGGGGRPDMAQAGGPNADAANDAVQAIESALAG